MKFFTPEISWHEREPIYTCAYNPVVANKFATAGVTGEIRLWELNEKTKSEEGKEEGKNNLGKDIQIDFIANLKRHTRAVNIVRWSHDGKMLASAGDEPVVFVWVENDVKNQKTLDNQNDEFENKENWFVFKTLRGHLEDIYDVSWSSDGSTLVSGSIDNSAIVWNVSTGSKVAILKEPKGYAQGVAYDPLGATYGILSSDRCLRIYSTSNNKCIHNVNKIQLCNKENTDNAPNVKIFHDDTLKSFARRMMFSPDGNFLFTPSGCLELGEKIISTSYIFVRNTYNKPCLYIPHDKHSVAVSVCPIKFELSKKDNAENVPPKGDLFNIPYRYVFAVATEDAVFFYDTDSTTPFAYITGIHYSNLTDLSWSKDGRSLLITSVDGFCTLVFFKPDELGRVYTSSEDSSSTKENLSQSNSQSRSSQSSRVE